MSTLVVGLAACECWRTRGSPTYDENDHSNSNQNINNFSHGERFASNQKEQTRPEMENERATQRLGDGCTGQDGKTPISGLT